MDKNYQETVIYTIDQLLIEAHLFKDCVQYFPENTAALRNHSIILKHLTAAVEEINNVAIESGRKEIHELVLSEVQ